MTGVEKGRGIAFRVFLAFLAFLAFYAFRVFLAFLSLRVPWVPRAFVETPRGDLRFI